MSKKNILILTMGVFLGAALSGFLLTRYFPYTFHGVILQAPAPAPDFSLTAHTGTSASLKQFDGKLVIMFFGYTNCPDVCPATLGVLSQALKSLGKKADKVQVLFVTVDPARDTAKRLETYLTHFNPNFIGLTGSLEEIAQVAALYGVYFEAQPSESEGSYWMDHTASTMVIDQEGRLKLVWPFGVTAEDVASDLRMLLK